MPKYAKPKKPKTVHVKRKPSPPPQEVSVREGERLSLAALRPDKRNARKHNARNIGMLEEALKEVGAARSIVIDEDNTVLAGNATVEAAGNAGLERVRIVEADGHEIVAVRRRGLTDEQKKRLALYDNRVGELSEWDTDEIQKLLDESPEMLRTLFVDVEVDKLLAIASTNAKAEWEGMPEFDQQNEKPYRQIIVSFRNDADAEQFGEVISQQITDRTRSIWFPPQPIDHVKDLRYAEANEP